MIQVDGASRLSRWDRSQLAVQRGWQAQRLLRAVALLALGGVVLCVSAVTLLAARNSQEAALHAAPAVPLSIAALASVYGGTRLALTPVSEAQRRRGKFVVALGALPMIAFVIVFALVLSNVCGRPGGVCG